MLDILDGTKYPKYSKYRILDVLDVLDSTKYPKYPKYYILDVLDVLDDTKYPEYPEYYMLDVLDILYIESHLTYYSAYTPYNHLITNRQNNRTHNLLVDCP